MTSRTALADALKMPWCPERNIVLRAALGIEVGMINRAGVIIAVCPNRGEARRVERLLARLVRIRRYRREDGQYVVSGEVPG